MNKKLITSNEYIGRFQNKQKIIDFSDEKGNCNGCNDCCGLFAPISKEELIILKRKMNKKLIKKYENIVINKATLIDMTCMFADKEKGCLVYNLKPDICKHFHCKPGHADFSVVMNMKRNSFEYFIADVLPECEFKDYVNAIRGKMFSNNDKLLGG